MANDARTPGQRRAIEAAAAERDAALEVLGAEWAGMCEVLDIADRNAVTAALLFYAERAREIHAAYYSQHAAILGGTES